MIIDTHCHLQDFGERAPEVWARSVLSGVTRCITVGTSLKDCIAARGIARELDGVSFAGGLHPVDAERHAGEWEEIRQICCADECVAVGETGLDFFKGPNEALQLKSLDAQLQLAAKLRKPAILHVRPSARKIYAVRRVHDVLFSTLRQHPDVTCVFHCFSGSLREAREAVAMGHFLSFAGTLTFGDETGRMLAEVARFVPGERIMVETDAPYIRPAGCPGRRNEPAFVKYTLKALAQAQGWTLEEAIRHTSKNAREAFRI